MLGFRELTDHELEFVSGGWDVVGPKISTYLYGGSYVGGSGGSYWDSGQDDRYGEDDSWDPNGDDDGDGILNQDEFIQVDGAKSEQIANWNDFSKSMTVWTEWYITLSTAVLGTEFAAYKAAMEAALGQQLAGIVSAVAGKLAGDASEEYIKDFWFEYARDVETQPNLNPLSYPQDGGYIYYP